MRHKIKSVGLRSPRPEVSTEELLTLCVKTTDSLVSV